MFHAEFAKVRDDHEETREKSGSIRGMVLRDLSVQGADDGLLQSVDLIPLLQTLTIFKKIET